MVSLTSKYVLVAGLGRSGISAATFFRKMGYEVIATDIDTAKKDTPKILELEALGIKTEIGFHSISTFENAGMIVVSPGIPLDGAHFQKAIIKGIPIRGELDIAAELIKEPIVAITGTNGKTTVTTLISEMLKSSGFRVFTGGNIGTPLIEYLNENDISLSEIDTMWLPNNHNSAIGKTSLVRTEVRTDKKYDVVVAEVSSFQLDTAKNFSPDVAVLLNITEDHMNRYSNFDAYADSKWSIFGGQNENGHAIINICINNAKQRAEAMRIKSKITFFNTDNKNFSAQKKISKLKGKHNQENIEASILASLSVGASIEGIEAALRNFSGLPHRIQYVATINGVDFYNDSKGTNTDATARAVEAFDKYDFSATNSIDKSIILIMGGQDKNMDFSVLKDGFRDRIKNIVLIGEAKDKIYAALYGTCNMMFADDMEQAVKLSFDISKPGDTVLLSPACASFDMYGNYQERGEDFIKQVKTLI